MNHKCERKKCGHPTRYACAVCGRWVCRPCHEALTYGRVGCQKGDRLCSQRCIRQYKDEGRDDRQDTHGYRTYPDPG